MKKGMTGYEAKRSQPPIYVATLDTGGMKYSGREYVAVAATVEDARLAIGQRVLADGGGTHESYFGDVLTTPDEVDEYYGIQWYGPVTVDGPAVRRDEIEP